MFLASMANISIPAIASPTVTFKVDPEITTGVAVDGLVMVNVSIEADPGAAIIGWAIDIKVDPNVLTPGFYYDGEWYNCYAGGAEYFLYDWCADHDWQMPTPTNIMEGSRNETTGIIDDTNEAIKLWKDLGVGNGTDGTGTLATFYFTSLNETAWSPIEITAAYYYTSWEDPAPPHPADLIINGHYNVPKHEVVVDGKTYYVTIESNSSVYNFAFNEKYAVDDWRGETSFNVTGPTGTTGFCNVTIPKNLTYGAPWLVLVDGAAKGYASGDIDATSTWLYFTYTHGDTPSLIQIYGTWVVPEFSAPTLLMTLLIVALAVAILAKRARSNKRKTPLTKPLTSGSPTTQP